MASQQIIQNIVGGSRHSNMNVINVSHCQNMYFETQGEGASSTSILRSIQGMETILEIEGVPRGRFEASRGPDGNPRLFECFGTSVYVIDKDPVPLPIRQKVFWIVQMFGADTSFTIDLVTFTSLV